MMKLSIDDYTYTMMCTNVELSRKEFKEHINQSLLDMDPGKRVITSRVRKKILKKGLDEMYNKYLKCNYEFDNYTCRLVLGKREVYELLLVRRDRDIDVEAITRNGMQEMSMLSIGKTKGCE